MPLAVTFPLSGRFGDLHPLEYVRAGRTTKNAGHLSMSGVPKNRGYLLSHLVGQYHQRK